MPCCRTCPISQPPPSCTRDERSPSSADTSPAPGPHARDEKADAPSNAPSTKQSQPCEQPAYRSRHILRAGSTPPSIPADNPSHTRYSAPDAGQEKTELSLSYSSHPSRRQPKPTAKHSGNC